MAEPFLKNDYYFFGVLTGVCYSCWLCLGLKVVKSEDVLDCSCCELNCIDLKEGIECLPISYNENLLLCLDYYLVFNCCCLVGTLLKLVEV